MCLWGRKCDAHSVRHVFHSRLAFLNSLWRYESYNRLLTAPSSLTTRRCGWFTAGFTAAGHKHGNGSHQTNELLRTNFAPSCCSSRCFRPITSTIHALHVMALGNGSTLCDRYTRSVPLTTATCGDASQSRRDEAAGPAVGASWAFGAGDSSDGRRGRKDKVVEPTLFDVISSHHDWWKFRVTYFAKRPWQLLSCIKRTWVYLFYVHYFSQDNIFTWKIGSLFLKSCYEFLGANI